MDGKTLEQLKESLMNRWRKIDLSGGRERDLESMENYTPHAEIIDIAQDLEQMGRDTSLAEQERRELLAIERALSKMVIGSFGICEECSEEIPPKRLMVLPEARLCANCQAYEERQSQRRMPGVMAR